MNHRALNWVIHTLFITVYLNTQNIKSVTYDTLQMTLVCVFEIAQLYLIVFKSVMYCIIRNLCNEKEMIYTSSIWLGGRWCDPYIPVVGRSVPALAAVHRGLVFGGRPRGHWVPVLGLCSVSIGWVGCSWTFPSCNQ